MRRFRLLLSSIRHVRPAQLAWRVRLRADRFVSSRWGESRHRALARRAAKLANGIALADAPRPFGPRRGLYRRDADGYVLTLLGREIAFGRTVDWGVARAGRASQLWGFHLHYHEFLEEAATEDFTAIVLDWIASNPSYAERSWYDSWSPYAVSLRVVVWMQQIGRRRSELSREFLDAAARSLVEQVLFLESHLELDIRGNHLLKNVKALLFASTFLKTEASARWRVRGSEILLREIPEQILSDGLHFERSPAYHGQVFADLLECHLVLDDGPLKSLLTTRLAAMAQALADTTHPDGWPSLLNDGGLHMAYPPAELLAVWSALSGERSEPRREVRLDAAGYFGLRDGNDLLLVDAGRIGPDFLPGHGHGDILSFEWSVASRRIAVDTGVFEYAEGAKRTRARATASHNTVTVDAADQCEFYGSFRVGRRAAVSVEQVGFPDGGIALTASHDGYCRLPGGGVHRRTVRGGPGAFSIDDAIAGSRGSAEAWIVLHPEATVSVDGGTARIACGGVVVELTASGPITIQPWEWWPDFGLAVPTTRLRVTYGPLPAKGRLAFRVVARP